MCSFKKQFFLSVAFALQVQRPKAYGAKRKERHARAVKIEQGLLKSNILNALDCNPSGYHASASRLILCEAQEW